jgi:hypothetical protein
MSTHARAVILSGNAWLVRSADEEHANKFHYRVQDDENNEYRLLIRRRPGVRLAGRLQVADEMLGIWESRVRN